MFKRPPYATKERFHFLAFSIITAMHLLALAAPYTFTWAGFAVFCVMTYVTGGFGITLAYHRLLTHGSFKTSRWMTYLLTFFACLALEGGPIYWVATHRLHHKESDTDMDPHSPRASFLWAHVLWIFFPHPKLATYEDLKRLAPDLDRDGGLRFLEKYNVHLYLLFAIAMYGVGYYLGGVKLGTSLVVWGCVLRTVYTWHVTWLVNSATHLWGYRNYDTNEDSRNNWFFALLTFGEGWHNNHHGNQRSANFGHRWFEFDISYAILQTLQRFGLVHSLVLPNLRVLRTNGMVKVDSENEELAEAVSG